MGKKKNQKIVGTVSVASKRGGYFLPEGEIEKENELFIETGNLNTARNGDRVAVENGKVIQIIERAKKLFAGTVATGDDGRRWLKPHDTRLYDDISIDNPGDIHDGDRVIVKITNWDKMSGQVVEHIGRAGDNETEMATILFEHKISYNFSGAVEEEARGIAHSGIAEKDLKKRRDYRQITTFTIDPIDAKDFDDAISFQRLNNGTYEIGVHIADVSHYVRPGSALDTEAVERATSVYLVDRTIPMLPEILSNGLCSLLPNVDRLTFSAVFILDKNAKILDRWFGKTIIHSDKRFTYEEVDEILQKKQGVFYHELSELDRLAKKMREERFTHGSVSLETDDVKFKLDASGKPIEIIKRSSTDSHHLIEEFMLLANKKVAEHIFYKGGREGKKPGSHTFVYRIHDKPDKERISDLKRFLKNFNYKFSAKDKNLDSKKLNELIMQAEAKPEERLVKSTVLRSMARAVYTTKNIGHFGLAFTCYTHFTSPIRRYPDIMVHRLLDSYLSGGKSPKQEVYEKLCRHSSQMERKAMEAEWDSIRLKQAEYSQDKIGSFYTGVITGVTDWGLFIECEETMVEGMVHVRRMEDDHYFFDKKIFSLVGKKSGKKYRLGDKIRVKLQSVDIERRTIDFSLA